MNLNVKKGIWAFSLVIIALGLVTWAFSAYVEQGKLISLGFNGKSISVRLPKEIPAAVEHMGPGMKYVLTSHLDILQITMYDFLIYHDDSQDIPHTCIGIKEFRYEGNRYWGHGMCDEYQKWRSYSITAEGWINLIADYG